MKSIKWPHSSLLIFILSLALFISVLVLVAVRLAAAPLPNLPEPLPEHAPDVSVIQIETDSFKGHVNAYGAVQPRYTLELSTKVSGTVATLFPQLDTGSVVREGEILLQLDDSEYRSALENAKQTLAEAKVTLLEEMRQAQQAQSDWHSSGLDGDPESLLVLREPYVESARAAVASAEAEVLHADRNVAYTTIRAPFDALVVERLAVPGKYVPAGATLATLYGIERVEITLNLSANQWKKLPDIQTLLRERWPVQLRNIDGGGLWKGYVARVGQHLDSKTRQRALIVAVDSPMQQVHPLLPGTFVDVEIPGRSINDLWELPVSAMSQQGEIWYVTTSNTLGKFNAVIQFSDGANIYVKPPEKLKAGIQQVLVHPLNSYLQGTLVTPVLTNSSAVATLPSSILLAGDPAHD